MAVDRDRIREVYLEAYAASKDSAQAWNSVLEAVAPFSSTPTDEELERRRETADALREMQDALLLEAGDPLALAIDEAMSRLRGADVVREARSFWRRVAEDLAERRYPRRRQDWTPDFERRVSEAIEQIADTPHLFIFFDEEGELVGWNFEWSNYETRREAVAVSVPLSDTIDYDDIEREIGEALAMAQEAGDIEFKEEDE